MAESRELKEEESGAEEEFELEPDDLENVSGGVSLRSVNKVKTTPISQDTIGRI